MEWKNIQDEQKTRAVLARAGVWYDENRPLPEPFDIKTGVGNVSRLYFVHIPAQGSAYKEYVAKFKDEAHLEKASERSAAEWKAIQDLRNSIQSPYILLPIPQNTPEDGVIISDSGSKLEQGKDCVTLARPT